LIVDATALLSPLRFRFTEPADVQRYGGEWHIYDEAALMRLPAQEQIDLEEKTNTPLVTVIRSFRKDGTLGMLAATWIALHLEDPDLAGPFPAYAPTVHFTDWERVPAGEAKAALRGPFDETPSTPSSPPPLSE
jgi:hypothetical protein